jgi:O-antigen ligase
MSRLPVLARLVPLYLLALSLPLSLGVGTVAVVALAGIAGMVWILPPRRPVPVSSGLVAALALYLAIHVVASLASPYPVRWHKVYEELWMKLLLVLIPILIADRPAHAVRAVKLLVTMGALVALYSIVQHYVGVEVWRQEALHPEGDRYQVVGLYAHHLSYGGSVMLLWVLALAYALSGSPSPGWARRGVPWAAVAVLTLALLWSYARSAQIGAGVALVLFAWALPRRRRWVAAAVAIAIAVLVAFNPVVTMRFREALEGGESTRVNLWKSSWAGIQARPWLGYGLGHFQDMMALHEVPGYYDTRAHAHSDYLMHAVNAGILGLAAALGLIVATVANLWRRRRAAVAGWLVGGALACQAAIAAAGLFQVYQTDDEVELTFYFVLGCALASLSRPAPPPIPAPAPSSSPVSDD